MENRLKTEARPAVLLLVSLSVALFLALTLTSNAAVAAGGPFSGSYSGNGSFGSLTGSGTATFIGSSSITSRFHCGTGSCLGNATLTSSTHPTDALRLSLFCLKPCPNPIHWHYNVTSGTGIFGKATGGGTAIYTLSGGGTNRFMATFTGTLTF